MPKYVIERRFPHADQLSPKDLQIIAQKVCSALDELGPEVKWLETFVTHNKLYCIYEAPNAEHLIDHSLLSGLPADRISKINTEINPAMAKSPPGKVEANQPASP